MRLVLDTNVVVSGIFFSGPPAQLLEAWSDGAFELVVTPAIFAEYEDVCERLGRRYAGLKYRSTLSVLLSESELVVDPPPGDPITVDPDDDVFMRCAASARATVVSGDHHLLEASGWSGVEVITPRECVNRLGLDQP